LFCYTVIRHFVYLLTGYTSTNLKSVTIVYSIDPGSSNIPRDFCWASHRRGNTRTSWRARLAPGPTFGTGFRSEQPRFARPKPGNGLKDFEL